VVVSASPGSHWQSAELVGAFLDQRQQLLPLIDVQEDLVRRLFERHPHRPRRFIDLGAGDGAMSQLVLSVVPDAEAVLVDFSEPMLDRAGERLGDASWSLARADLSTPSWRDALPDERYGAAVSSYAIHHLPAERKRALFAEVFELLEPGAMFVNLDVVQIRGPLAGLFDEEMIANAQAARGEGHDEHAHEPLDDEDEDRPDPAESQIAWLRDAGFEDVELHFKWAEGAIFGAVKPLMGEAGSPGPGRA
jgi:ubiquinone/menaquinone biosynthesis C-methylase UbiE